MKNPFVKQDNTALIAGIAIGTIAAGAVTYLLISDKGSDLRKQIADEAAKLLSKFLNRSAEDNENQHGYDYRQHESAKTPKTDRDALVKDQIISRT